jgi:antitoxin MazE
MVSVMEVLLKKNATLSSWGNSKAVRLPMDILNLVGFGADEDLIIEVDGDKRVIIEKVKKNRQTLAEMFSNWHEEYPEDLSLSEWHESDPVGDEIW